MKMGNNSPHYGRYDCPCRHCREERTSTTQISFSNLRDILKESFSYTIPNAKCPICKEQVFYYENSFGSKVYFDKLGKPWPKHGCFIDKSELPLINDDEIKLGIDFSENYFPVKPKFIKELLEGYCIFEIAFKNFTETKFVIKERYLGITFLDISGDQIFLNCYNIHEEYSLECIQLDLAKKTMPAIFPYKIGEPIDIEIRKENDHGIRTEIFMNRKLSTKEIVAPRAFIYNAPLSNIVKTELSNNGFSIITAISKRNGSNEIIFTEIK
jgi:hypothetical protein